MDDVDRKIQWLINRNQLLTRHKHQNGEGGYIVQSYPAEGRLTLASGAPEGQQSVANASTLYYTPYVGQCIALWYDQTWRIFDFTEQSLALGTLTASMPHDIFAYYTGTQVALTSLAWTNTTTRATAITRSNGVYVRSGMADQRYLGTIYLDGSSYCQDTLSQRFVWNMYNRTVQRLSAEENTVHSYNGGLRKWNNSDTNNKLETVCGLTDDAMGIACKSLLRAGADGSIGLITPYVGTGEISAIWRAANYNVQFASVSLYGTYPEQLGYRYFQVYELGNHASSQFSNMMIHIERRA